MTSEVEHDMKKDAQNILGLFDYADDTVDAINELQSAGYSDMVVFSPIPLHDVEHAIEHGMPKRAPGLAGAFKAFRSRDIHVLRFTLIGMFGGLMLAWLLTFGTALAWPIPQGGMPIIALPPIGLISYELGTLGAALGTIGGFLYMAKLPTMKDEVYDISVGSDKFGIALKNVDSETFVVAGNILKKCGAVSIEGKEGVLR